MLSINPEKLCGIHKSNMESFKLKGILTKEGLL